jgi:hypothetical protein
VEEIVNFGDPALPDRFWDKVTPIPFPSVGMMDGCWVWTGSTTGRGYGSFYLGKTRAGRQRTGVAHIMTYEAACGRIKQGRRKKRLVVDHRCRTRCCCNPNHLELVLEPENVRRGESPAARNARKTHCRRGHEYTPENTYTLRVRKNGRDTTKRYCRACRRPEEEPCRS